MQVLYLCEIPLLDRSLLAVILKGLPKVTMVGIYDCPLIGFSDLLSILDIVHTVNNDRVTAGLPKIDSLDLRPYFETGQAADWHDKNELHGAAEYGISWAPINLKTWQRGFYGIILRAVIKSESMGLKLLFDKHCALLEFLFRVPNVPLGVPTFLDGLYRWLDLSKTHDSENKEMKKAMFDMLKPVCVTIDSRWDDENSSSKWYQLVMGQEKYKCAICGFSTLAEFFYMAGCRMCSVCELERELSMQKHHHMNVLECPKVFFKHGERFEPNDEVTLLPRAAKLLERTNHAISLETPSVRQLRTLEELARPCLPKTVNLWQPLIDICNCLDYRVRVVRFGIREGYFKRNDPYPPCPHGLPSTNWQHQPPACSSMSRTWASALEAHKWHMEAGWVPGFKPKGLEKPIIW